MTAIILLAALVAMPQILLDNQSCDVASASTFGTVTISQNVNNYVCSSDDETLYSDTSLQNVIDYAESAFSQTTFIFNSLGASEPIIFKKNSLLQGTLYFALYSDDYALTVASNATLIIQGLVLNSTRGAIRVNYNGNLEIRSAYIITDLCDETCSTVDVRGNALISGGTIAYRASNSDFGYGVSVNDGGNLLVTPDAETPVKIEGHSALCMSAGDAEINGGEFKANGTGDSSAGYSIDAQNGNLTINGGTFLSPIYNRAVQSAKININGGSGSIRVTPRQNKKLNIGSLEIFAGLNCELNIDFTQSSVSIYGKKSTNGFRTVGFTVGGTATNTPTLTAQTDQVAAIVPIEDNHYNVYLSCDGEVYKTLSYTYNSTVKLDSLPYPDKVGYTVSGWEESSTDIIIRDDVTLSAITALCAPTVDVADETLTYNGEEQTITPILSHDLSVSYTFSWEKYVDGNWTQYSDEKDLKVTAVADSGRYRFIAVATHDGKQSTAQTEITVTINKGTYTNITHPALSGVYDPDMRLSGYTLQPYFSWAVITTIPTVPQKQYPAVYNADPQNYNDCELFITVDLEKAAAVSAPPHDSLSGVYEKKMLKDYPLNDGFRWQSPETIPVVKITSYAALYNPDVDNYEDTVRHIVLRLKKGDYDESVILDDISMTYRPNYYLSDFGKDFSAAHEYYKLILTADKMLSAGRTELDCIYNDDSDNYNDYPFTFALIVKKADISAADVPKIPSFTGVYSGLPLSSYVLTGNLFWRNPDDIPTVDIQEYDAFYNPDRENYNDYPITVSLILKKGSYGDDEIKIPTLDAITYQHGRKLMDISLPTGWRWMNPNDEPTVAVNSYPAEYCIDTVNYLPFVANIALTVNKADIKPVILQDKTVTYDGKVHSLEFESLPYPLELVGFDNNGMVDSGKYEITARLLQKDTVNYNLHPTTVRGTLLILKAPSIINAPTRYDVLQGNAVTITGTVENSEQNLVIPSFNETAVGVHYITLTTAESRNYLAGSLGVTISINKSEMYVGNIKYPSDYDGSYLYGILVNNECGVPNDAEIIFRSFPCDDYYCGIEISVKVGGSMFSGNFVVKIRMTDDMLSASNLKLFSDDGAEIEFTVENGVYLVFETDGNNIFYMQAEFNKKFAWYWIPIGIAIGLIVIGAVLVVLYKKGIINLPIKAKVENSEEAAESSESAENNNIEEDDSIEDLAASNEKVVAEMQEETVAEEIKEQESEEDIKAE